MKSRVLQFLVRLCSSEMPEDLIIAALGGVCLLVPWEHSHKAMPVSHGCECNDSRPPVWSPKPRRERAARQASKEVDVMKRMKRKAVAQLMLIDRRKPCQLLWACMLGQREDSQGYALIERERPGELKRKKGRKSRAHDWR